MGAGGRARGGARGRGSCQIAAGCGAAACGLQRLRTEAARSLQLEPHAGDKTSTGRPRVPRMPRSPRAAAAAGADSWGSPAAGRGGSRSQVLSQGLIWPLLPPTCKSLRPGPVHTHQATCSANVQTACQQKRWRGRFASAQARWARRPWAHSPQRPRCSPTRPTCAIQHLPATLRSGFCRCLPPRLPARPPCMRQPGPSQPSWQAHEVRRRALRQQLPAHLSPAQVHAALAGRPPACPSQPVPRGPNRNGLQCAHLK